MIGEHYHTVTPWVGWWRDQLCVVVEKTDDNTPFRFVAPGSTAANLRLVAADGSAIWVSDTTSLGWLPFLPHFSPPEIISSGFEEIDPLLALFYMKKMGISEWFECPTAHGADNSRKFLESAEEKG